MNSQDESLEEKIMRIAKESNKSSMECQALLGSNDFIVRPPKTEEIQNESK